MLPFVDDLAVAGYIVSVFEHVEVSEAWGYTMFFYRDAHRLPFATLIAQNTEHDRVSNLDRPGVYRLNIGIEKATFQSLFNSSIQPDYTALDQLMPHPDYAAQSWICILAPNDATFESDVKPLLEEAYRLARRRYERRLRSGS